MMNIENDPNDGEARRIFIVEDEGIVAADIESRLQHLGYHVSGSASSGEEALTSIPKNSPDLVLMDIRLAGQLDGVETAAEVRRRFDLPVVYLTAHTDQATLDRAKITESFGYIIKPFEERELQTNIEMGLYKHKMEQERARMLAAEKQLVERILGGSIQVLTEILATVVPQSFGHGQKFRDYILAMAKTMDIDDVWELEMAAILFQIGFVCIPATVIQKLRGGMSLTTVEKDMVIRVPEFGRNLLARIPRLEAVAPIVLYQNKNFNGTGFPQDSVSGTKIPLGARMLKILADIDRMESSGVPRGKIADEMKRAEGLYDPTILAVAIVDVIEAPPRGSKPVTLESLRVGDALMAPIVTGDETVLVAAGNTITPSLLEKLNNFAQINTIKMPIYVEE